MEIPTPIVGEEADSQFFAWVESLTDSDKCEIDYMNIFDCALARFGKSKYPNLTEITASDCRVYYRPDGRGEHIEGHVLYEVTSDVRLKLARMPSMFSHNQLKKMVRQLKSNVEIQGTTKE